MSTEEDIETLRTLIRESHEAIQAMREEKKNLETYRQAVNHEFDRLFEDHAASIVKDGLDKFNILLHQKIEEATKRVFKRFDEITDILLGETKAQKRKGEDLLTLAHKRNEIS